MEQQNQSCDQPQHQEKDILEIDKQLRENFDNYQTEAILGEGTYGKVYKVKYSRNQLSYAMKIFKPVNNLEKMYEKELQSMKRVQGKRQFVQLFAQLDQFRQKYKGIVMEFCQGGELLKYIMVNKGLEEQDVRMFLHQIVDILQTLQDNKLAHLDIKPENFFLDEDYNLILGDFGMCEELQQPNQVLNNYRKGSPSYQIIELVRQVPYKAYDADIFAAGVTIFSIYSCLLPFKHLQSYGILFQNPSQFWNLMRKNSPNHAFQDQISKDFVDLFMKMVHPDPNKRITLEQIKVHPFYIGSVAEDIRPVSTLQQINANQNTFQVKENNKPESAQQILTRGTHLSNIEEEFDKYQCEIDNLYEKRKPKVYQEKQGKLNDFSTNIDCETLFKYLFIKQEEFTSEIPVLSNKSFKLKCVQKYNDNKDTLTEQIEAINNQKMKKNEVEDPVIQDILNSVNKMSINEDCTDQILKFNINIQLNDQNSKTYVTFTKKEGDTFEFFKLVASIQNLIKTFN